MVANFRSTDKKKYKAESIERLENFINTIGSSPFVWVKFIDDSPEDDLETKNYWESIELEPKLTEGNYETVVWSSKARWKRKVKEHLT